MGENVAITETLYTYDAAINRYEAERHHSWLCRQKRLEQIRKAEQERRRYFLNQKLCGFMGLLMMLIVTIVCGNPVCLVLAFPGVYAMFTNKMILVNEYWRRRQQRR